MNWQRRFAFLVFAAALFAPPAFGEGKGEGVEIERAEPLYPVEHHFVSIAGGLGEMEVHVVEYPNGQKSAFVWIDGFDGKSLGGFGVSLSSDPDRAASQKKWAEKLAFEIALEHLANSIAGWDNWPPDGLVLTDSGNKE